MMDGYSFDELFERKGTDCIKHDAVEAFLGAGDVIPMWVADMDFRTPPFIVDALRQRIEHEVYAYTMRGQGYYDSLTGWLKRRHQWEVPAEAVLFSPGVVPAINMAVLAFTRPGDRILTQPPVYFPFFSAVKDHGRELVYNPLVLDRGRLCMDFDHLEKEMKAGIKMFVLCNPHNPGGSVWTREELLRLAGLCLRYEVLMVSDEIHCDLVFKPFKHLPLATLSEEVAARCITLTAPSKTFNLSGLSTASVIITDEALRKTYKATLDPLHIGGGNIAGNVASQAAYANGDDWVDQLNEYLSGNLDLMEDYFQQYIPRVKMLRPEATFLVWLDCRDLGLDDEQLNRFFLEKARLGLNRGDMFGPGGSGFMRMNIGCPRATLIRALEQLREAVGKVE